MPPARTASSAARAAAFPAKAFSEFTTMICLKIICPNISVIPALPSSYITEPIKAVTLKPLIVNKARAGSIKANEYLKNSVN